MDVRHAETQLRELEARPAHVQLHHAELEALITTCMDEVYALAETGGDDDRKMKLVAIEYRVGSCSIGFASCE